MTWNKMPVDSIVHYSGIFELYSCKNPKFRIYAYKECTIVRVDMLWSAWMLIWRFSRWTAFVKKQTNRHIYDLSTLKPRPLRSLIIKEHVLSILGRVEIVLLICGSGKSPIIGYQRVTLNAFSQKRTDSAQVCHLLEFHQSSQRGWSL